MTNTITKEELIKQSIELNLESIGLAKERDESIYILEFFGDAYLKINPDWIKENFDEYEEFIIDLINQYKNEKISFNQGSLISDKIIDAICANDNIKEVSIASGLTKDGYTLTNDDYKKFKTAQKEKIKSTNISNDLSENFDSLIAFNSEKNLIGSNRYADLQKEEIYLYNPLDERE